MIVAEHDIKPPWLTYPRLPPQDIFWRQSGEAWAVNVWLPFWSELTPDEQTQYLNTWNAPPEWREYYDPETQAWLAEIDGIAGYILRNNLCQQSIAAAIDTTNAKEKIILPPSNKTTKLSTLVKNIFLPAWLKSKMKLN